MAAQDLSATDELPGNLMRMLKRAVYTAGSAKYSGSRGLLRSSTFASLAVRMHKRVTEGNPRWLPSGVAQLEERDHGAKRRIARKPGYDFGRRHRATIDRASIED
jgi:hypothetical protein